VTVLAEGPRAIVRRVGERLGAAALAGDVIALVGDLGAGKTFLARAIARGAGVPTSVRVVSPTFTILQNYAGRLPVFHADLYRIASAAELDEIGLFAQSAGGLTIVEWADRASASIPGLALWITLERVHPLRRRLVARGESPEARRLIAAAVTGL
jgi:tRNA threonylcarbamoyl adenosine modification protein YjeE